MADGDGFEAFVRANSADLLALAISLCRDRQQAEDLVQGALVGAFERWPSIRRGEELRYLRRSIVNGHISRWRRVGRREYSIDLHVADVVADPHRAVDLRMDLVAQLRRLPARQRAVLVLRYLCDLSDEEISATLGTGKASVRSNAHRGLARLRAMHEQRSNSANAANNPVIGEA